jgi:hypothetical protein
MIIKICDRCGSEIEKEKVSVFENMAKAIHEAFCRKPVFILTNKTEGTPADLCPRCMTSLNHWMRYGEAIKEARDRNEPDAIIRDGKRYELKKEEHPEEKTEETHAVEEIHITDDSPSENIPKFGEF